MDRMYIVTGQKPYGTCDVVPELFHVATVFFHVNYAPLIPLRSMIILEKRGDEFYGVNIPMSFKSVLLAWGRMIAFLAMMGFGIFALILWESHRRRANPWIPTWLAVASGLVFLLLMIIPRRKASYARACELGRLANLSDQGWAALNVMYGRDPLDGSGGDGKDLLRPTEVQQK
jgi:hypothetical protein